MTIISCALALIKDHPLEEDNATTHYNMCFGSFIGQFRFVDESSHGFSASASDRLTRITTDDCFDELSLLTLIVRSGTLHLHVCLVVALREDIFKVRCPYENQFRNLPSC